MNETYSILDDLKVGDIIIDSYWEGVYRKWGWKNPTEKAKLKVVRICANFVYVSECANESVTEVIFNPTSDYYRKEVAA